jgi:ABC-2 type transport system permease protein
VRGIVNNLTSSSIAVFAAQDQIKAGKAPASLMLSAQAIAEAVNRDLQPPPITLSQTTVTGKKEDTSSGFDPLSYFGPAMAVFFLTFTMAGGAGNIIEEQDNWTLQRLLSSPTPRSTVLAGKLAGNYLNGLLQLSVLIVAMAFLGVVMGARSSVWGTNIPGIILVTLSAVAAACGLGTIIAGAARNAQQADIISNALLILMGIAGGAFFDISQMGGPFVLVSRLTVHYWATNAYATLAQTGNLAAVLPNIAVLLLMFAVFFGIGVYLFNRRLKT